MNAQRSKNAHHDNYFFCPHPPSHQPVLYSIYRILRALCERGDRKAFLARSCWILIYLFVAQLKDVISTTFCPSGNITTTTGLPFYSWCLYGNSLTHLVVREGGGGSSLVSPHAPQNLSNRGINKKKAIAHLSRGNRFDEYATDMPTKMHEESVFICSFSMRFNYLIKLWNVCVMGFCAKWHISSHISPHQKHSPRATAEYKNSDFVGLALWSTRIYTRAFLPQFSLLCVLLDIHSKRSIIKGLPAAAARACASQLDPCIHESC